jgi:hypothetical protein
LLLSPLKKLNPFVFRRFWFSIIISLCRRRSGSSTSPPVSCCIASGAATAGGAGTPPAETQHFLLLLLKVPVYRYLQHHDRLAKPANVPVVHATDHCSEQGQASRVVDSRTNRSP